MPSLLTYRRMTLLRAQLTSHPVVDTLICSVVLALSLTYNTPKTLEHPVHMNMTCQTHTDNTTMALVVQVQGTRAGTITTEDTEGVGQYPCFRYLSFSHRTGSEPPFPLDGLAP